MNHLLITTIEGNQYIVKKSDIRRIYSDNGKTTILFTGTKNTPLKVPDSVEGFFNIYLSTK